MYVAASVVAVAYLILWFVSRKETIDALSEKLGGALQPFYRMAVYIYKRICIHKISFLSNVQAEKDLVKMHPGKRKEQLFTEYYAGKWAKSLMICLVGTFLGLIISVQADRKDSPGDSGGITRGNYEEGARAVDVECILPEGIQEFTIEVGAQTYDEKEINALYEVFRAELPEMILGDNPSLQEISKKMSLQESYEGYPFDVHWESNKPELIRNDGTLECVEEIQEAELRVTIGYEDKEWEENLSVRITPIVLSEEERIHQELENLLLASEKESRTEEEWRLPDNWEGRELLWRQKTEDLGPVLWVGAIVVSVLVYLMTDKDLHSEVEKRRLQMKKDYPDVVHKLVLYLGAGMTIRGTFQRMANEYEQSRTEGKRQCAVYEELLHTCRELKAGESEGVAYEQLGKRTGLQEYIRLTTLLAQNLKKGNSTLLQRLREEAGKASAERLHYGRRLGEEAVTKLLLPMVMMLLVVMLIIMIPAFSSVGI